MAYVFSTLTAPVAFTAWQDGTQLKSVTIAGGAGVSTKHFITPRGVSTQVSDEDLDHLEKDSSFAELVKNGFLTVEKKDANADKVASDMNSRDKSAPATPESLIAEGKAEGKTGKAK